MARIFGTEIPNDKRIEVALTYVYGIGLTTSKKILELAGIDENLRAGELTSDQIVKITSAITSENVVIEGELRRQIQADLKRITAINCHRGQRHKRGLPVRGQRTKTNARTRKGKKRTVGVQR